jgi:hypothetical protein
LVDVQGIVVDISWILVDFQWMLMDISGEEWWFNGDLMVIQWWFWTYMVILPEAISNHQHMGNGCDPTESV